MPTNYYEHATVEMPNAHLGGGSQKAVGCKRSWFKGEVTAGGVDLGGPVDDRSLKPRGERAHQRTLSMLTRFPGQPHHPENSLETAAWVLFTSRILQFYDTHNIFA